MARKKVEELNDPDNPEIDGLDAAQLDDGVEDEWDRLKAMDKYRVEPHQLAPIEPNTNPVDAIGLAANANRSSSLVSSGRTFNAHDHDWVQHGRTLSCKTCPENTRHGTIIKAGHMLTGKRGAWEIVPERGTPKPDQTQ